MLNIGTFPGLNFDAHSEAALLRNSQSIFDAPLQANVEVWVVSLDASETATRSFRSLLSSEEVLRADRFVNAALTESYQTSHGVLRVLLSRYLNCDPREIEFTLGWAGKPVLKNDTRMHFNLSHSGGLAAYAFTEVGQIGVDIEKIRNVPDLEDIAEHNFCSEETTELLSIVEENQRREAFFRCWTRKESFIKAVGYGLSVPLDEFRVTLLPDAPARLVHIRNSEAAASAWTMHHLEPTSGYVGALSCMADAHHVKVHTALPAQDILDVLLA